MAATPKMNSLTLISYSLLRTLFRQDVPFRHNTKRYRQTDDRQTDRQTDDTSCQRLDRQYGRPKTSSFGSILHHSSLFCLQTPILGQEVLKIHANIKKAIPALNVRKSLKCSRLLGNWGDVKIKWVRPVRRRTPLFYATILATLCNKGLMRMAAYSQPAWHTRPCE